MYVSRQPYAGEDLDKLIAEAWDWGKANPNATPEEREQMSAFMSRRTACPHDDERRGPRFTCLACRDGGTVLCVSHVSMEAIRRGRSDWLPISPAGYACTCEKGRSVKESFKGGIADYDPDRHVRVWSSTLSRSEREELRGKLFPKNEYAGDFAPWRGR